MKALKHSIICALCAALLLSFTACGRQLDSTTEEGIDIHDPANYSPNQKWKTGDTEAGGVVVDYRTEALATTEESEPKPPTPLQQPPNITVSYQYKLGEIGLVEMCNLFPAGFSWTVENENGVGKTTHVDALRPYDNEKTQRLKLERVADYSYTLDIGWQEAHIESYTLRAYPIGKYEEHHATACTVENGKLALLRGAYYYEWIIQYSQGTVTYGFFVE